MFVDNRRAQCAPQREELRIEIERERALAVREQRAIYKVTGQ